MSKLTKVSFIGLGVMGYHMAGHILKSGRADLLVYNRTTEKSLVWRDEFGGKYAESLEQAVSDAEVIIVVLVRMKTWRKLYSPVKAYIST
jgi:3-hydroxyisobutyrate dehydrogenase